MVDIPAISREYLYLPGIKAFDVRSPDQPVDGDPTGLPVEVAFMVTGAEPADDEWTAAEWADTTTARVLIGPASGSPLPAGQYRVWLRVVGATERPERPVGILTVR